MGCGPMATGCPGDSTRRKGRVPPESSSPLRTFSPDQATPSVQSRRPNCPKICFLLSASAEDPVRAHFAFGQSLEGVFLVFSSPTHVPLFFPDFICQRKLAVVQTHLVRFFPAKEDTFGATRQTRAAFGAKLRRTAYAQAPPQNRMKVSVADGTSSGKAMK